MRISLLSTVICGECGGEGGVITITIYLDLSTWSYFYRRGHTHYPVSTFRPYIGEIAEKSK